MTTDIPVKLRDEDHAVRLVESYLATDSTGQAQYSGAHFERLGGGGDRPEVADRFTAEDLLAVTMLSVRIVRNHALHVLQYRAEELNALLATIPPDICLADSRAEDLIAVDGPAWTLWTTIRDIKPPTKAFESAPWRQASSWHASART